MLPITIKVAETTYNAAKEKAERRGYLSVEEYVSDWLEHDSSPEIPMTPELELALEQGLADSSDNRVVSREELDLRHEERRAQWIKAHQK